MAKKQEKTWQYKVSFALSLVMLLLIFGYFAQSFLEIRKVKPVTVAIERISERRATGAKEVELQVEGKETAESDNGAEE